MKLRITTVAVVALAFGLVAGPALAQEGFTEDSCGEDIGLAAPDGFTLDDLPTDLTLAEICSIYGVEVLDVITTPPPGGEEPGEEPSEVGGVVIERPGTPAEAPQVLGVTLARTGIDAAILALAGLGLLGLGVFAVRRQRETSEV